MFLWQLFSGHCPPCHQISVRILSIYLGVYYSMSFVLFLHGTVNFLFLVWTVRPGNCLRSYLAAVKRSRCFFMRFSLKARLGVHYIVTDMNAPYFSLVKECFPNAQVIVDRFHIVQHLNRFFDAVRKRVMKTLDQKTQYKLNSIANWNPYSNYF